MIMWLGIMYTVLITAGGLWMLYLHKKGELVGDYPYDDEM